MRKLHSDQGAIIEVLAMGLYNGWLRMRRYQWYMVGTFCSGTSYVPLCHICSRSAWSDINEFINQRGGSNKMFIVENNNMVTPSRVISKVKCINTVRLYEINMIHKIFVFSSANISILEDHIRYNKISILFNPTPPKVQLKRKKSLQRLICSKPNEHSIPSPRLVSVTSNQTAT